MKIWRANYEFRNNGYTSTASTPWFTTKELVREYLDKKGITGAFCNSYEGPRLDWENVLEEIPEHIPSLQEDREYENEIQRIHNEIMSRI